jgi:DHA2 family multidrug resistance protein
LSAVAATAPQTGLARALVLLSVILATTLYATTLTIANVALPQMQGDLSASIDQIAWVLTFNIVATAIATPPTGCWGYARQLDPVRQPMKTKDVSGFVSRKGVKLE